MVTSNQNHRIIQVHVVERITRTPDFKVMLLVDMDGVDLSSDLQG